jgi:hypothetical protein
MMMMMMTMMASIKERLVERHPAECTVPWPLRVHGSLAIVMGHRVQDQDGKPRIRPMLLGQDRPTLKQRSPEAVKIDSTCVLSWSPASLSPAVPTQRNQKILLHC